MPKQAGKHAPRHRKTRSSVVASRAPRRVLRNTLMLSSVAAAATAGVVSTGMASSPVALGAVSTDLADPTPPTAEDPFEVRRAPTPISRSDSRSADDVPTQQSNRPSNRAHDRKDESGKIEYTDPRDIGRALLPEYGFSADQFACLDALYVSESDWRVDADNPTSSAYGIPQALTSMHDLPDGYMTDPEVQIRWGLEYIQDSYGSPCSAWAFKQANNYY
jgi:hypothetical protein